MPFADKLKRARLRAGLTQPQLAARSGVPQPTISRLEAGKYKPQHGTLLRLARALGVSLDALAQ